MSKEIRNSIFNLPEGGSSDSSSWTPQKIAETCLFFASDSTDILNKVSASQLPNQVTGAVDYLTVTGNGLDARYRTPNTAPYKTADSDYVFWKTNASESICDGNRLIGYDFPRILVKYLNVAPYTILWIAILKPGVTVTNGMRDAFDLSIWWDNILSSYGYVKGNKGMGQSIWTPEALDLLQGDGDFSDSAKWNVNAPRFPVAGGVLTWNNLDSLAPYALCIRTISFLTTDKLRFEFEVISGTASFLITRENTAAINGVGFNTYSVGVHTVDFYPTHDGTGIGILANMSAAWSIDNMTVKKIINP